MRENHSSSSIIAKALASSLQRERKIILLSVFSAIMLGLYLISDTVNQEDYKYKIYYIIVAVSSFVFVTVSSYRMLFSIGVKGVKTNEISEAHSQSGNAGRSLDVDITKAQNVYTEQSEDLVEIVQKAIRASYARQRLASTNKMVEFNLVNAANAVETSKRRANQNLIAGVSTAAIGVALLAYAVIFSPEYDSIDKFVIKAGPKMALSILVEVLAMFFLRAYRDGTHEMRHYQSELMTCASKMTALIAVTEGGMVDESGAVISQLSTPQINRILDKGQTTVELEKSKIDNQADGKVLEYVERIMKAVRASPNTPT